MKVNILKEVKIESNLFNVVFKVKLTFFNEIKNRSLKKRLRKQKTFNNKKNLKYRSLKENDLILIKRLTQNE